MKNLRYFAIADYLKEKKRASVEELRQKFNVSQATIHRDINALAERGVLERVLGGVVFLDNSSSGTILGLSSSSFAERASQNRAEKNVIARKALSHVCEGDILFLDSSTTVACLAEHLANAGIGNLTIITNSVAIIQNFHRFPLHHVLISLGGNYDAQLNSLLSQATVRELERLAVTKAFVSAFGVDDRNVTTNHERQAGLLSRVFSMTSQRFLLADHTKFGRTGLYRLADKKLFDDIISN